MYWHKKYSNVAAQGPTSPGVPALDAKVLGLCASCRGISLVFISREKVILIFCGNLLN